VPRQAQVKRPPGQKTTGQKATASLSAAWPRAY